MQRKTRVAAAAGATVIALAGAGAAVVNATSDDGGGTPISGTELERASAAALAATGGGRVTATEVGDEDSYYEVEVTLTDGSQVDVQLDRAFHVVTTMTDGEGGHGDTGQD